MGRIIIHFVESEGGLDEEWRLVHTAPIGSVDHSQDKVKNSLQWSKIVQNSLK